MIALTADDRRTLLDYFVQRYTLEQLDTLLFVVGLNRNNFSSAGTLDHVCADVITYCLNNGQFGCLLREALRDKPDPNVQAIYARSPSCEAGVKVEVTIHDAGMKDLGAALKAFLEAHGLKANEVSLVAAGAGSLRLLLSVPAETADRLLTYPVTEIAGGASPSLSPSPPLRQDLPYPMEGSPSVPSANLSPGPGGEAFHVASVRAFRDLTTAQQQWWQQTARTTPGVSVTQVTDSAVRVEVAGAEEVVVPTVITAAAGTGIGIGRIILIILVVVVAGAGAAVVAAPGLNIHNSCGRPLPLPVSVPFLGDQVGEGDSSIKIPPGDYTVSRTLSGRSAILVVTGPIVGSVQIPLDARESASVQVDGASVQIGPTPTTVNVGLTTGVDVTLCP